MNSEAVLLAVRIRIPVPRRTCRFLFALSAFAALLPAQSLILSPAGAPSANALALNLSLTTPPGATQPAALQWAFTSPGGALSNISVAAGPALLAAQKSLICYGPPTGLICVASGINTNTVRDGVIAIVSVTLASPAVAAVLAVGGGIASDFSGNALPLFTPGFVPLNLNLGLSLGLPSRLQQIAVFRASGNLGLFTLDQNEDDNWQPADPQASFGLPGDIPIAGDFLGTGVIEMGVFRCTAATGCLWYIDANNNGAWDGVAGGDTIWSFGLPGDLPVTGDWTGDGITKIGVFRCPPVPGICTWILDAGNKHAYDPATALTETYGLTGDKPVVSNWAGGPVDTVGVFRGNGQWIVDSLALRAYSPGDAVYSYGLPGDYPVVGNWYGDLASSNAPKRIGVFRPQTGQWILNRSGSNLWLPIDPVANFGLPGDLPVVGFWTIP